MSNPVPFPEHDGTNMCPLHGDAPARHAVTFCTCGSSNAPLRYMNNDQPKPTDEFPCTCVGTTVNLSCKFHMDPHSPLQKQLDKVFSHAPPQEETTPHSDHIGKATDMVEEPWVAEFNQAYKFMFKDGKAKENFKTFIQKTLEADRKERAERVENIIKELRGKGLYDDDLYAHFYRIIKGY